ncbi:Lrp/AsnC family transcriptional regulator [Streptomyces sp. TS71-3]|uniref:Lrp/AsnC family transcriptional regulator n=1 Tax=Streptomyces sp. TS71-3 TaxID=2733862 RepID=UPI001B28F8B4|nr:Lrp/AsnC family transcriptional regulator [Streptomyces sp. TS71-3]GHJ36441.1 AsnC family transcriptional regulator [Streptomyces sp. TS71-3]
MISRRTVPGQAQGAPAPRRAVPGRAPGHAPGHAPGYDALDRIDRALLRLLAQDSRASYQELGKAVRLSANATAERVRRLRRGGVIRAYTLEIEPAALGQNLRAMTSVKLRDDIRRVEFEARLAAVPQVVAAFHTTGQYDYELTIDCVDPSELEFVVGRLKEEAGVRDANSRLVLSEVPLDPLRVLEPQDTSAEP